MARTTWLLGVSPYPRLAGRARCWGGRGRGTIRGTGPCEGAVQFQSRARLTSPDAAGLWSGRQACLVHGVAFGHELQAGPGMRLGIHRSAWGLLGGCTLRGPSARAKEAEGPPLGAVKIVFLIFLARALCHRCHLTPGPPRRPSTGFRHAGALLRIHMGHGFEGLAHTSYIFATLPDFAPSEIPGPDQH